MEMKECPICHGRLIHGYIKTSGEVITWSPNFKKKSIFATRWQVDEDELCLGKFRFWKGAKVDAYKCDKCKKVIIDIDK